jgi:hypothetical protein
MPFDGVVVSGQQIMQVPCEADVDRRLVHLTACDHFNQAKKILLFVPPKEEGPIDNFEHDPAGAAKNVLNGARHGER